MAKNGARNGEIRGANARYLRREGTISRLRVRLCPQTRLQAFLSLLNYSTKTNTQHATMTGNEELIQVIPMKGGYFRLFKRL